MRKVALFLSFIILFFGANELFTLSGAYAAVATSANITTNAVADMTPDTAAQGETKIPIITFSVTTGKAADEKLKAIKLKYTGTNKDDLKTLYLYMESGTVPGTFDGADIEFDRNTSFSGNEMTLDPTGDGVSLSPDTAYQFYVVADLASDAAVGNAFDFKVEADKITFNSGLWPSAADVAVNGWDPSSSTTAISSITTYEVAQIGAISISQGATNAPILSFTISNADADNKFKSVRLRFNGTASNPSDDIGNVYLYQESVAISGSSFDVAADTLKDTTAAGNSSEIYLNPIPDFFLNGQEKFYVVVDVKADAVSGHRIDFTVETGKIELASGVWPPDSEVTGGVWNPTGNTAIGKIDQTITFGALSDKHFGDADFDPSAAASSALSVDYTAVGSCNIVGGQVHITRVGNCEVTANQGGDTNYNPALAVSRSFSITDNTPPVIALHADVFAEATSTAGAWVTFSLPNANDDVDGIFAATCSPDSNTNFAIGSTTVTCNANDTALNSATTTTFEVGVHDTTAPVISLTGNVSISLTVGDSYTEQGATATDIVDGTDIVTVGGDVVNTSIIGTYHITYNAVDSAGNRATEVIRTVIVGAATSSPTPVSNSNVGNGAPFILGATASPSSDLNGDGRVGAADLAVLMANWGSLGRNIPGDMNNDGKTDVLDFAMLMANWTI